MSDQPTLTALCAGNVRARSTYVYFADDVDQVIGSLRAQLAEQARTLETLTNGVHVRDQDLLATKDELAEARAEIARLTEQVRQQNNDYIESCFNLGVKLDKAETALEQARAEIARLTEESEGRKRVLLQKAEEARQEWIRAEQAEASASPPLTSGRPQDHEDAQ